MSLVERVARLSEGFCPDGDFGHPLAPHAGPFGVVPDGVTIVRASGRCPIHCTTYFLCTHPEGLTPQILTVTDELAAREGWTDDPVQPN